MPIFPIARTRRFFSEKLEWSSRKEINDGQKTPKNWEVSCEKTFFKSSYTVPEKNIHITFIVNIDQTGVVLVLGANDAIYEIKGVKQIPIHGKEEKHDFTSDLSSSCKVKVLSVHTVWKGVTSVSLPIKNASQEAFAAGHRLAFNRDTHWSSPTTTKA